MGRVKSKGVAWFLRLFYEKDDKTLMVGSGRMVQGFVSAEILLGESLSCVWSSDSDGLQKICEKNFGLQLLDCLEMFYRPGFTKIGLEEDQKVF